MKNTSKITLLGFLIVGFLNAAMAQNVKNTISGKIEGYTLKDNSTLTVKTYDFNQIKENYFPNNIYNTLIDKNGRFTLDFTPSEKYFYLTFTLISGDQRVSEITKTFWNVYFLFEAGDSVNVKINIMEKRVEFEGRGASKLQCQAYLASMSIPKEIQPRLFQLHSSDFESKLTLQSELYKLLLKQQKLILSGYNKQLDSVVYSRIYADAISQTKFNYIYGELLGPFKIGIVKYRQPIINHFNKLYHLKDPLVFNDDSLLNSPNYPGFLLNRDALIYEAQTAELKTQKKYIDWVFDYNKTEYQGLLRDKIIPVALITNIRKFPKQVLDYLPEAAHLIRDKRNRKFFNDWVEKQTIGSQASKFSLQDISGKYHHLNDYRDKIIIMDFWFTGCHGCMQIPPKLSQIYEKYKHRDDVVFISVSIDRSKETWEFGLNTGKYTFPGQIHLYTNGLGRNDPFAMNYNINIFPRLIIIGKNSRLISANPPDPRKDNGIGIIGLINQAMK